jgi:hypothetical protein
MKIISFLLLGSLAANAALFGIYLKSSAKPTVAAASAGTSVATEKAPAPASSPGSTVATDSRMSGIWAELQTDDLPTLVARLRAAGFPPYVVRAVITGRLEKQFAQRAREIMKEPADRPFWKENSMGLFDAKTLTAMRALGKEFTETAKALLGPDALESDMGKAYRQRRYGSLSADKIDQVQNIESDYSELTMQVQSATRGIMLPDDTEKLQLLEKEKRADIAKLLTPQELEEYDMRSSTTANRMRSQLALFNPTEDEFRAIFKIQQALDAQFPSNTYGPSSPEQMTARRNAEQQVQSQFQAALGAERYAAYQQATNPDYQQVNRLVARLELPASVVPDVVGVQQDIQKRASALRMDRDLTPDQRNAQLATLAQEAQTKLTASLGAQGFEAYKDNGGYWLRNLQPRPTPTTRPAPGTTTPTP